MWAVTAPHTTAGSYAGDGVRRVDWKARRGAEITEELVSS